MPKWIRFSGIILIISIAGCSDDPQDDLKLPVRTHVTLGFLGDYGNNEPGYSVINEEGNQFQFLGSTASIQKIEFEGIREVGENVIFETDPDISSTIIDFNGCKSTFDFNAFYWANLFIYHFEGCRTTVCEFDLPSGVYKYIRLDLFLNELSDDVVADGVDVSLLNTGFLITGKFIHHWGDWKEWGAWDSITSYPIVLAIESDEKFIFRSLEEKILKQQEREIFLALDIMDAFDRIDFKSIEEAEKMGKEKLPEILISRNSNRDLYEMLLYRLGLTAKMFV